MSDNLRDRIAAAIEGIRMQRDGDSYKMADAIIAALDMRLEIQVHYLNIKQRWATEWEIREDN